MKTILYFTVILFLSFSCTSKNHNEAVKESIVPKVKQIDLSEGGLPLALEIGESESISFTAKWNEAFGRMELSNDSYLNIMVSQDTMSCKSKKSEIESGIFKVFYIENTDSLIFYKTTLPDGSNPYWHFFASFKLDEINYNFENDPLIECTEKQVKLMTELVGKIRHAKIETADVISGRLSDNRISDNRSGSK